MGAISVENTVLYTFYWSLVTIISTKAHNNTIPPVITSFPVTDKLRGKSMGNMFFFFQTKP